MYTSDDIIRMIDLIEPPYESEVIEFKEAKSNFPFKEIGQYFSAISNEALLREQREGWLIFGMDNDKQACGTNYRVNNPGSLQSLKREIASSTSGRLTFREIHDFIYKGKRLVVFEIPPATPGLPTAFNNAAYAREGDSLVPLPIDKYETIRQMRRPDWSATIIDNASFDDLDPEAVNKALELFLNKHASHKEGFSGMETKDLLDKAKITRNGKITATALILLGKPESVHHLDGVLPRITWTLYASDGSVVSYEHFEPPLLLAVDKVSAKIRNEKYRFLANGESLFPIELSQYDVDVLRELLNNCIAHQDYSYQGRININEFEDHLEFINEGSFIPGTIEQAMQPGYKPPYYRNPFLCDAMVEMDMIDTIAMGIPTMFRLQRNRYFPLPTYDFENPNRVHVSLYGKSIDESYSRLLHARPDLSIGTVYLLDRVQKREPITQEQATMLHEMNLIEGRYPRLTITKTIAAKVDEKASYTRSKGLNDKACKELILQMLKDTGPTSRKTIVGLIEDLLPVSLSRQQKQKKASNLLQEMKREGLVAVDRVGKSALWSINEQ